MPDYVDGIKYPLPEDRYNTSYGEPEWWRDLAATTAAAIAESAYWQGGVPLDGSTDLLELAAGTYAVWGSSDAAQLGLPEGVQGILEVYRYGSAGRVQTWKPRSPDLSPQIWQRHWRHSDWSPWTRMDTYDWWRGESELSYHADDPELPSGIYTVWSSVAAPSRGFPTATQGVLEVVRYGRTGGIQRWSTRTGGGEQTQLWQRQYLNDRWDEWVRIDAGSASTGSSGTGSGFKTLPLAVTVGNGGTTDAPTSLTVRYALHFNAPITRWRVRVANRNARSGSTREGNIEFADWQLGTEESGGSIGSAETVIPAFATDGTGWVSKWITTPIGTDTPLLLSTSYDASTAPYMQVGACWRGASGQSLSRQTTAPFEVWIEAETPSTTPSVAALGSSTDAGSGGTRPVVDSTIAQWAREYGALPVHYTHSGDAMASSTDPAAYKWTRWAHLSRPDTVLFALGSNDVYGNASLAELQDRHATVTQIAAARISPVQYGATVFRRANAEADTRVAYNAWLEAYPNALRDVFDFAAAIGSPPDPAFDADGVHLNDAGQTALLASIDHPLTSPALADPDWSAAITALNAAAD